MIPRTLRKTKPEHPTMITIAMREFTAMTQSKDGGTECVTIRAMDAPSAQKRLLGMGYFRILWVV